MVRGTETNEVLTADDVVMAAASGRAFVIGHGLARGEESTSALDVSVQAQTLSLLRQLQSELGMWCLFIKHSIGVVEHIADHASVINRGRTEESIMAHEVLAHSRSDCTRTLLAARCGSVRAHNVEGSGEGRKKLLRVPNGKRKAA